MNDISKLYETFSSRIDHEDTLFASRITWLVSFQSFLIFPFFLIQAQSALDDSVIEVSVTMLGTVATFSNLFVLCGCVAADNQIRILTMDYLARINQITPIAEDLNIYKLRPSKTNDILGAITPYGTIFIFGALWTVTLLQRFQDVRLLIALVNFLTIFWAIQRIWRLRRTTTPPSAQIEGGSDEWFYHSVMGFTCIFFSIACILNLVIWSIHTNISNMGIMTINILGFLMWLGIIVSLFLHRRGRRSVQ